MHGERQAQAPPRRVAVVFNPTSGHHDPERRERTIREAFGQAGIEPVWLTTTPEDAGGGQAAAAVKDGVDLVAVNGGDGTVRAVATALSGTGVPMAVLPGGTGNLLAVNLHIPTRLEHAVEVALDGRRRAIDVCISDAAVGGSGYFLVMAGLGFDAAMLHGTNPALKRRFGTIAYARSGLAELRYPQDQYTLTVDGSERVHRRASAVLIANLGRISPEIPLVRDAEPDDGQLRVAVIRARSRLDWIQVASRVLFQGRWGDVRVEIFTGRKVEVHSEAAHLVEHDGEVGEPVDRLVVEVAPAVLTVCVPAA
jgi:diacylglycerol kinase (ATP)